MNTLVLFDESGAHVRSAATIRICLLLEGRFTLLGEFLAMIPEPLRDAAYNWIARNRYRFFGQRDACRLPTPDVAGRFLAA
jgi:predicted DCC family thiol-disulfide oxidoreductase YuxK